MRNIAVVPGIFGSRLLLGNDLVWGDRDSVLATLKDADRLLHSSVQCDGILREFPFSLLSRAVAFLQMRFDAVLTGDDAPGYQPLLTHIAAKATPFPFAYKWTRSAIDVGEEFGDWLQRSNPDAEWTIVAHSFGGLVVSAYLSSLTANRGARIREIVACGTPLLGSARALGWLLGIPAEPDRMLTALRKSTDYLDEGHRKGLARTLLKMDSTYDLLPLTAHSILTKDGTLADVGDLKDLLRGPILREWEEHNAFDRAAAAAERWQGRRDLPGLCAERGIEFRSCFSRSHETPALVELRYNRPARYQRPLPVDGDETVLSASAVSGADRAKQLPTSAVHGSLHNCSELHNYLDSLA